MGDSVGLGSDFDGMDTTTHGLEDVSTFPALVRSFVRAHFTLVLTRILHRRRADCGDVLARVERRGTGWPR